MNRRRIYIFLTIVLSLGLTLGGCKKSDEVEPIATETATSAPADAPLDGESPVEPTPTLEQPQAQVAQSALQRNVSPHVQPADLDALVAGNSAFAFDLYHAIRQEDGNLFFSPYSVSAALAMTYAGARGETERQMAETLHFTLAQDRLHPAFNALDWSLTGPGQDDFQLNAANALWGRAGYDWSPQFLETLAENYGAGLRLLDLSAEAARQEINAWVSQRTEGRITDVIPPGGITPDANLVLVNAIYFSAGWLFTFDETRDGIFHTLDGEQVPVDMMSISLSPRLFIEQDVMGPMNMPELAYTQGDGYQAVELPYQDKRAAMLILVPDAGQFEAFEAALNLERVQDILGDMWPWPVMLTMPKFAYQAQLRLADVLAGMGMPDAFGAADFSGMDGTRNLFIDDIFHKTFITVDEIGTEAAAATAAEILVEESKSEIELIIDRPFIFFIRDTESGALLFVGRVVNPG